MRIRKSASCRTARVARGFARSSRLDGYSFAAEVAMHQLSVEIGETLDGLLCNPDLASRFDELAAAYSPGYSAFEYRWAALSLRKRAKEAKQLAERQYHDGWAAAAAPKKLDGKWSNLNCREYTCCARRARSGSTWRDV